MNEAQLMVVLCMSWARMLPFMLMFCQSGIVPSIKELIPVGMTQSASCCSLEDGIIGCRWVVCRSTAHFTTGRLQKMDC